jgi:hypothetical protein
MTGPSLTGSEFGGPGRIDGTIFQYKICRMDRLTLVLTRSLAKKTKENQLIKCSYTRSAVGAIRNLFASS